MSHLSIMNVDVRRINRFQYEEVADLVAVEEPLEIRLIYGEKETEKGISITMRTPGNDSALAAGFLFTEGILKTAVSIKEIRTDASGQFVNVCLHPLEQPVLQNMDRNFYTTSSCGVCGKASIDAIKTVSFYNDIHDEIKINANVLYDLHEKLLIEQKAFERTGGLHASALFDIDGTLIMLQEDVGRHNALDKLIGSFFLKNALPLNNHILLLSGRASFELIQKSVMAGIKLVVAVGAPSSLAIHLAIENNITLIGFLRSDRFNIYCGDERIDM